MGDEPSCAAGAARWYTVLHSIILYALFLILFLAFAQNRVKPPRVVAVLLAGALLLRLAARAPNLWSPQRSSGVK